MAAVTRLEAQAWVDRLRGTRRARHHGRPVRDGDAPVLAAATITAAGAHDEQAVPDGDARVTAARHRQPVRGAGAGAIDVRWRLFTELGTQVGLRPGELAGLHGHRVDWLRSQITVVDVMTRQSLRQYPKSRRSHRVVPVPADVLENLSLLMAGREREALVFTAPEGGPVNDVNFRNRVWWPAVEAAGIRRFPPRIMRHTAASWIVMDGVPLYDVQALLGHESFATTQR